MEHKKEAHSYPFMKGNRQMFFSVNYTLVFNRDKLVEVRNEGGYPVERNSECWEHFATKYNQPS